MLLRRPFVLFCLNPCTEESGFCFGYRDRHRAGCRLGFRDRSRQYIKKIIIINACMIAWFTVRLAAIRTTIIIVRTSGYLCHLFRSYFLDHVLSVIHS